MAILTEDEEFASQVAEYVASIPVSTLVRMKLGVLEETILAMAKEKGYEDGPRFVRYMKMPEGLNSFIYDCGIRPLSPLEFKNEELKEALATKSIPAVRGTVRNIEDGLQETLKLLIQSVGEEVRIGH